MQNLCGLAGGFNLLLRYLHNETLTLFAMRLLGSCRIFLCGRGAAACLSFRVGARGLTESPQLLAPLIEPLSDRSDDGAVY